MRRTRKAQKTPYLFGFLFSSIGHFTLAILLILVFESRAAQAGKVPEVFTVTLEGGEKLGGITQIPDKIPEKPQPLPKTVNEEKEAAQEKVEQAAEPEVPDVPEVESPSVIAEREKKAEEQRLKKEAEAKKLAEKKRKQEQKQKQEELKRKQAEEKKRKEQQRRAKEIKDKARRKKEFEKRLSQVRKGLNSKQYEGESYDAGGQGFGAAKLGGKGTGGGSLASIEKVAYMNALEQHIKRGWRWIMGNQKLTAIVRFRILKDGTLQKIELSKSSGNSNFDDSVMRAVRKASPVPPPPAKFYLDFSDVRLIFDSKE